MQHRTLALLLSTAALAGILLGASVPAEACKWKQTPFVCFRSSDNSCVTGGSVTSHYEVAQRCAWTQVEATMYCLARGAKMSWNTRSAPASATCQMNKHSPGADTLIVGELDPAQWPGDDLPTPGSQIDVFDHCPAMTVDVASSGAWQLTVPEDAFDKAGLVRSKCDGITGEDLREAALEKAVARSEKRRLRRMEKKLARIRAKERRRYERAIDEQRRSDGSWKIRVLQEKKGDLLGYYKGEVETVMYQRGHDLAVPHGEGRISYTGKQSGTTMSGTWYHGKPSGLMLLDEPRRGRTCRVFFEEKKRVRPAVEKVECAYTKQGARRRPFAAMLKQVGAKALRMTYEGSVLWSNRGGGFLAHGKGEMLVKIELQGETAWLRTTGQFKKGLLYDGKMTFVSKKNEKLAWMTIVEGKLGDTWIAPDAKSKFQGD